MADPDSLADLIADVRAVLEDASLRGVLAEDGRLPPPPAAPAGAPPEPRTAKPSGEANPAWSSLATEAREARPDAAGRLARVREELGDCQRCGLAKGRKTLVFGVGDPDADLVVVGEAPGHEEDRRGEPFVGAAGQMLDKMLENVIGLPRSKVYILNVIKCRPPKNRNPLPDEVEACMPFLRGQIEAIEPKVLLVLGSVAFKSLFDTSRGITRARGIWTEYEGTPVMPTFHPAYLLRQPQDKRLTFEDLKAVRQRYDELGGRR
ncbi:MAG: uracil-DNA glycosylase [Myxococcota bacterium]